MGSGLSFDTITFVCVYLNIFCLKYVIEMLSEHQRLTPSDNTSDK